MKNINEYRLGCETCKLDLTDTALALKDCRAIAGPQDHSMTVVVGILSLALGLFIGAQVTH